MQHKLLFQYYQQLCTLHSKLKIEDGHRQTVGGIMCWPCVLEPVQCCIILSCFHTRAVWSALNKVWCAFWYSPVRFDWCESSYELWCRPKQANTGSLENGGLSTVLFCPIDERFSSPPRLSICSSSLVFICG